MSSSEAKAGHRELRLVAPVDQLKELLEAVQGGRQGINFFGKANQGRPVGGDAGLRLGELLAGMARLLVGQQGPRSRQRALNLLGDRLQPPMFLSSR